MSSPFYPAYARNIDLWALFNDFDVDKGGVGAEAGRIRGKAKRKQTIYQGVSKKEAEANVRHGFVPGAALLALVTAACGATEARAQEAPRVQLTAIRNDSSAQLLFDGKAVTLRKGESNGDWTLVETLQGQEGGAETAVLENYANRDGHLMFVGKSGVEIDLPKTSEPTFGDPAKLYLGHSFDDVMNSAKDLLANEILAKPGDPTYEEIAAAFAPIQKIKMYSFVGTHDVIDKVGFQYGGRTPNFDPAPYYAPILKIREDGKVWDGLVGGYLPVLRFVYPEDDGSWTEMLAFAPLRISNGNQRIQPVWYRVSRIEAGKLKWSKYIDSYHPFPPRTEYDPKGFYRDLATLQKGWNQMLKPGMAIDVPDERIANMARFALVRDMMTRVGDFPKYGVFDRDYAGSEHDGFPDTFTVDTAGMLSWGLMDLAGRYIDNYFGQFVRDDGSILYRGPETGQYGRMLTVAAQYVDYGGDPNVLLRRRSRIDGVTKLLLTLRETAKKLPVSDPAYGMIAGWSEADACLDPHPARYMQPYFSNSTEAARGFRDLGRVWARIGKQKGNAELVSWGERLQNEATALEKDIQTAITRSILTVDGEKILPAIAGVQEPFHIAVPKDTADPQFRSYRAYMEMLYSGILSKEEVQMVVDYRANHHDTILGVPTAYGYKTGEMAGFLSYGHGFGLIQYDMPREALLLTYSIMAHQYTRGTWMAPETRSVIPGKEAAPYCTPAQLVVALMMRWMLVFEDPQSATVWIDKATPREWLADGKHISATGAPTRWGRVSYSITSHLGSGTIEGELNLPMNYTAQTIVRLRAPGDARMKSVTVSGKTWTNFDAGSETITLPAGMTGKVKVVANYR